MFDSVAVERYLVRMRWIKFWTWVSIAGSKSIPSLPVYYDNLIPVMIWVSILAWETYTWTHLSTALGVLLLVSQRPNIVNPRGESEPKIPI